MLNRYIKLVALFFWIFLIYKFLTMPMQASVDYSFTFIDKFVHMTLFGVLSYLLLINLSGEDIYKKAGIYLFSFFAPLIYGLVFEYWQNFIPGRTSSIMDSIAGAMGSLLAMSGFSLVKCRRSNRLKLLLHVCCIGCGAFVADLLKKDYDVTLYFFNPNIYPEDEKRKRLEETKKVAKSLSLKLIVGDYNHQSWLKKIKGHEHVPEKGSRCLICYRTRLEETVKEAEKDHFYFFTSTLTVSPHKLAKEIIKIGKDLEQVYGVRFLDKDFKKNDGFKKSVELSNKLRLYRQDYCGCEFSIRK